MKHTGNQEPPGRYNRWLKACRCVSY